MVPFWVALVIEGACSPGKAAAVRGLANQATVIADAKRAAKTWFHGKAQPPVAGGEGILDRLQGFDPFEE